MNADRTRQVSSAFALVVAGLVLLLSVIPVARIVVFRSSAISDARSALTGRVRFIADTLDHNLQLRMVETFTLAALPSLRGFAASDLAARPARAAVAASELQSIVAADPNVRAASVVDPGGMVVLTTDASMNAKWGERIPVREALAGRLHASVPARDFGEISQYYSAPLLDNAGNVAGALVLRVAVQEFWNAFAAEPDVLVVDENGVRILDWTSAPQTFVALAPLAPDVMAQALAAKKYGAEVTQIRATNLTDLAAAVQRNDGAPVTFRDSGGQTVEAALRRLKTNAWTVMVVKPEDALVGNVDGLLWDELKIGLVALFVAIGAAILATRWLTQPRTLT